MAVAKLRYGQRIELGKSGQGDVLVLVVVENLCVGCSKYLLTKQGMDSVSRIKIPRCDSYL